jgi:hypothetical protein
VHAALAATMGAALRMCVNLKIFFFSKNSKNARKREISIGEAYVSEGSGSLH